MNAVTKWYSRAAAAVTGLILTLVIPVHAWAASNGTDQAAIEAARYRRRGGTGFFGLGCLCCLFVVGGIVLAIVLIRRNRSNRGPRPQ